MTSEVTKTITGLRRLARRAGLLGGVLVSVGCGSSNSPSEMDDSGTATGRGDGGSDAVATQAGVFRVKVI
jgi:hypothetical protein